MYTTIVSTDALASHLDDASWVVVDCRFDLADPPKGRRLYEESHLPGARYAGLEPDLSGPKTGTNGRHPLPDVGDFLQVLGAMGITPTTQVVAYDDKTGLWASRLWWMLRSIGHQGIAVLDGGLTKWLAEGRPVTAEVPLVTPAPLLSHSGGWSQQVSVEEVMARAVDKSARLIDARAPERYRGESESVDRVAGHIPGAANFFFQQSLDGDGTFLPPETLRAKLEAVLAGYDAPSAICYCGSGVTACHTLLTMEHAGLGGARLYPGSWSEWSANPARAIATGTES